MKFDILNTRPPALYASDLIGVILLVAIIIAARAVVVFLQTAGVLS